ISSSGPAPQARSGDAALRASRNEAEEARPIGAPLSQRLLGFTVDLLPALGIGWAVVGGNPLELLQVPILITDLEGARGVLLVMGLAWAFSAAGDVFFGRSLGKQMAGLRIVGSSGGPARLGPRIVRALASAVVVASPFVQLVALIHPRGLGPAEMLSGTCVVDARPSSAA
ncbi:MAG: RDD family protein, partial [Planctomycetota bacterium]